MTKRPFQSMMPLGPGWQGAVAHTDHRALMRHQRPVHHTPVSNCGSIYMPP
jgi:hypothetical protein